MYFIRYVRGVPLNKQSSIHIAGCGDLKIKDISFLPDPCPLPEQLKKRALVERERLIYAPFSGVGGIVYDKDAVYVELAGSHSHVKDDTGLVRQLLQTQETLDHKLEQSKLQFFRDSAPIKSQDVTQIFKEEKIIDGDRVRRKVIFNDAQTNNMENPDDDDSAQESDDETDIDFDKNNVNSNKREKGSTKNFQLDLNDEEDEEVVNDMEEEESEEESDKEIDEEENEDDNGDEDLLETESEDDNGDEEVLETENEEDMKEEEVEEFGEKINQTRKRKMVNTSNGKKIKLDPSTYDKRDEEVYHDLHINEDKEIKNKISEVLGLLNSHNLKKKISNKEHNNDMSQNESFDELSEDEEMDFDLKLESEEEYENEKEDKNDNEEDDKEENSIEDVKWKRNIAERAREAFLSRQQSNVNVMRLVYGVFDEKKVDLDEKTETNKGNEDVGGIFRVVEARERQKIEDRELKNQEESIFFSKEFPRNWLEDQNKALLVNRFVTGKWKESEDAEELLKLGNKLIYICTQYSKFIL
jgi:ribosome biogenesis protein BMS1